MRLVLFVSMALIASTAHAAPTVESRTAAAVVAADDAWLVAEVHGDGDYLERLLVPGYQSIGADGKATSREAIVAKARARGAKPEMAAQVAAWKAAHPTRPDVRITGTTAILTWVSTKAGAGEPVSSSDVFVYIDGHWRAVYSQHSAASS